MKQCNFGTNIQVSLWTPWIFFRGKFIPKIGIFGDFGWRKATFLKPQWWRLAWPWMHIDF